ncbi:DNA-binding XRE family transcriptional regulator [Blastococcus colisei]|uniref:DNA-binding XRE family transcriptional regulator n=1 Tax=Blastococcus colisei TaxID=1564162 RepID=A0A543P101_9ACTN|nr:helix-turn-helix domain-containing protein [Blastococcus colisei]TQN37786.1 DNA-binding XRE family transcriptional regulator [Blastococcus colisei]
MSTDRSGDAVYNRIALLRAAQGVTRRQLADALGVHYQTVGLPGAVRVQPGPAPRAADAGFFGLPVETIFSTDPFLRIRDLPRAADPD